MCVSNWGGGLGEEGKEAKKQDFLERKGATNILKHCCFLLITVNSSAAIIIPRDVKTSNLTNYTGQ